MEFKNDFSSNISGLNKNTWKKEIIIGIIGAIMVISLIIVIIIVAVSSSSSKDSEKKKEIGMINCIFDIQNTASSTLILGINFIKE
jgi:flagellar basal body-associated protein FliL